MKSLRLAVAGGTGRIGRHVVQGHLEIKHLHSLEIIVLSRTQRQSITYGGANASVIVIDYQDTESIRKVLDNHRIDTVISTISSMNAERFIGAQSNLLHAAMTVPSLRRFALSEFAFDSEQLYQVVAYRAKHPVLRSLEKIRRERSDSCEFIRFTCGLFMNYLGYGNPRPDMPGDGEKQLILTRAEDVGRFVAAATQLEAWEDYSDMASDVLTLNQVFELSENICGAEFEVRYNTKEDVLARMDLSQKNGIQPFSGMQLYAAIIDGDCDIKRPINLNKLVDVKRRCERVSREVVGSKWVSE